jgi:hypothetical protein
MSEAKQSVSAKIFQFVTEIALLCLPLLSASGQSAKRANDQTKYLELNGRLYWVSGSGRDTVAFRSGEDIRHLEIVSTLIHEFGVMDTLAALEGRHVRVGSITGTARPCGEANAMYDPKANKVIVCLELVADLETMFAKDGDPDPLWDAFQATRFFFAHELGHALIAQWHLPITGEAEDAADQFAWWLLTEDKDGGALIEGFHALSLWAVDEISSPDALVDQLDLLKDPHGLFMQRTNRMDCWMYGISTDASIDIFAGPIDTRLSTENQVRCAQTTRQARKAWDRLLAPYRPIKTSHR